MNPISVRTMKTWLNTKVLALLLPLIACSGLAQSWKTVDDFTYGPGGSAGARAAFATDSGEIYVAGFGSIDGTTHALVRRAGEKQMTWTTLDDFVYGSMNTQCWGVHVTPTGIILAAIRASTNGLLNGEWIIRRSTDHGVTWQTVDDIASPGGAMVPVSLASDPFGAVYALGYSSTTNQPGSSWVVRVSTDAGQTWHTGGDINSAGVPWQMISLSSNLFAVGNQDDGNGNPQWVARRSRNGGSDWETLDLYQDSWRSVAIGIGADAVGNLYVVGSSTPYSGGPVDWLVRRAEPGGINWVTSDIFEAGNASVGRAVDIDKEGNGYVTGQVGTGATGHMVTRQYSATTGQWTTSDDFSFASNGPALGCAVVIGSGSNVFVAGIAVTTNTHWIVRQLPGLQIQTPPQLQISYAANLVSVSWPTSATNYILETSSNLGTLNNWTPVSDTPQIVGEQFMLTFGATNSAQYFRLTR
jgi:hypothetical protein